MSDIREDAKVKANRLGLDLVLPGPDEIFVDLDSPAESQIFNSRFDLFRELWPDATVRFTVSVSGNTHAYVKSRSLPPMTDSERIALQAALGSDPFREMLAIWHARAGYQYTSVFFEKPGQMPAPEETEEPLPF